MAFYRASVLVLWFGIILAGFCVESGSATVTNYNSYENFHKEREIEKSDDTGISLPSFDKDNRLVGRGDKVGNVIFNDNLAFTSSSADSGRRPFSGDDVGPGGLLRNHRLEGPLSPEVVASAQVAAVTGAVATSPGRETENNGRGVEDSVHEGNTLASSAGHSRSLLPGEFDGLRERHGWASNPGSCLFSCNSGSFGQGYAAGTQSVSCCQLNYVQCCPNQHHEQWNFKNLHHGRGNLFGNGVGKSGFGWGSIPYNPLPIIKPRPCVPQHYHPPQIHPIPVPVPVFGGGGGGAGGSIIHKGIETIKHNIQHIGHIVKGSVGGGWGSGGNGASGYYFHRRSDNDVDERGNTMIATAKKIRTKRDINQLNGWSQSGIGHLAPCPVYSIHTNLPSPPYTAGLGSLIGWSKPGNQIHGNFGAGYYGSLAYPQINTVGRGHGWGGGFGSGFCKSDFECPGHLKCCKGSCQVAPHIH